MSFFSSFKNDLVNLPFKYKLAFVAGFITGLTLLFSYIALILLEYHLAKQDIEQKLLSLSQVLSAQTTSPANNDDLSFTQKNIDILKLIPAIDLGCIYDKNQQRVASFSSTSNTKTCPIFLTELIQQKKNISILAPMHVNDTLVGSLYIEAKLDSFYGRIKTFSRYAIIIFLCATALAFIFSHWFQSILILPMKNLASALKKIINSKDYSIRANRQTNDELGDLTDLFNNLIQTIEQEHLSLQSNNERFRRVASLSPVGIFQIDKNLRITYVNQRWRDIHNIAREIPDTSEWFECFSKADLDIIKKSWQTLENDQESLKMDARLTLSDKNQVWVQIHISALHDTKGELIGYLGAVSDISAVKDAQLQMEKLALYDPLTGLANRRLFLDRLENAVIAVQRNHSKVALLFLDMDQFKRINDTLGHDAGDILLQEVAQRLNTNVRENDTVARVGGDEFTILLTDIHTSTDVAFVAEKILKSLAKPIQVKGQEITTSVSIGITLTPDDSIDATKLLKNADLAMYHAKDLGRNNFQFFSEEINRSVLEHLEIEREITLALDAENFSLVFQPKINLQNFNINSMEVLLRWHHPKKGLITPDKFIPVAEETGQILAIGNWVLAQSCLQTQALITQGYLPDHVRVAVNLSAKQFSDPLLLYRIRQALADSGLPASCLELEITESTLIQEVESAILIMQEIKNLGVHIAIDDFGTGYSSLSYIKRFPIDVLKVDRSFVMDIPQDKNDMAITAAVIAMAHKLNIDTVAEGVETIEQLHFLRDNSCYEAQGFLFSRPLALDSLRLFLQNYDPANIAQLAGHR
ncbi:MAG: hypothetical protein RL217_450 [Pseudomonadota bacterium]